MRDPRPSDHDASTAIYCAEPDCDHVEVSHDPQVALDAINDHYAEHYAETARQERAVAWDDIEPQTRDRTARKGGSW